MTTNDEKAMHKRNIKIHSRKQLYKGFWELSELALSIPLFKGGMSKPMTRELFHHHGAAAILPYDPVKQKVVLVEQFRVGIIDGKQSPWLIEIPAGLIEASEAPDTVAIRELEEETNLQAKELTFIYEYWSSPGCMDERVHLYCATVDSDSAAEYAGESSEHEDIRVHVVPVETAFHWLQTGKIHNATAIIALQWLQNKTNSQKNGFFPYVED